MIVYAVSEDGINKLSILNINGAQFDLPSSEGMVREPAWSLVSAAPKKRKHGRIINGKTTRKSTQNEK